MNLKKVLDFNHESTYRANVINQIFIAKLMIALGAEGKKLDYLLSQSGDSFGYDLVITSFDTTQKSMTTRYLQMKTKDKKNNTDTWEVHTSLIDDPNSFLIVVEVEVVTNNNKEDVLLRYKYWDKNKMKKLQKSDTGRKRIKAHHLIAEYIEIEQLAKELFS
ncbi:hypothetical protein [Paenibacillus xylanexedens]|uniref:hypothetical protein n=1 Tax=Paenibacillus xylanexedens TaxID=528191 RepID=UPI0011AAC3F6|nr:hypothetical protein [Paenibacillus xylanexedens]